MTSITDHDLTITRENIAHNCGHPLFMMTTTERNWLARVTYLDDDPNSRQYTERVTRCPRCDEELASFGLFKNPER